MAGWGLTVDLRTLTRRATGMAFAGGWGTSAQGSRTGEGAQAVELHVRLGTAREAGGLGGSGSNSDQGRGSEQAPSPSTVRRRTAWTAQLCPFTARETEHPRPGRRGVSTYTATEGKPRAATVGTRSSGKDPPKPPCLHSVTHSLSRYLGTPCQCQDRCWALGTQQ